jgi:hypothetical protein
MKAKFDIDDPQIREDYRIAHRKLAIYGKVVIHLVQRVQDTARAYYRLQAEIQERSALQARFDETNKRIKKDARERAKIVETAIPSLQRGLARIKRTIFLRMEVAS